MEVTPDLQVQEAIRTVFAKFRELGTVRQVLLWYHTEKVTVPTFDSGPNPKVVWRLPVYARLHTILTKPVYCGVFVYGRRATRPNVVEGRAKKTQRLVKSPEACDVFIPNHHEGYISWAEFQENQARIRDNAAMQGRMESSGIGAAKSRKALLAGLLRCGKCGRSLNTKYGGGGVNPRYECRGQRGRYLGGKCLSLGGATMDRAVSAELLIALQPVRIEAALDAWDRRQESEDQKQRPLGMALDKSRYEANRIQRQFDATDPGNRLVAAELERRWNEALQKVGALEAKLELTRESMKILNEEDRVQLMRMGADLELVWNHPQCPVHPAERFHQSARRVHQAGPRLHQHRARADL